MEDCYEITDYKSVNDRKTGYKSNNKSTTLNKSNNQAVACIGSLYKLIFSIKRRVLR